MELDKVDWLGWACDMFAHLDFLVQTDLTTEKCDDNTCWLNRLTLCSPCLQTSSYLLSSILTFFHLLTGSSLNGHSAFNNEGWRTGA